MTERRKIQHNAIKAVQRLAAVHDPSGKMFNVPPVTFLEDGSIITLEALNRKKEAQARKEAIARGEEPPATSAKREQEIAGAHDINPERLKLLENGTAKSTISKRQMKKQAAYEPKPPPAKPIVPQGIEFPSDEEENWLSLWDLSDDQLERRVMREKKRAAKARKDLRMKQKSGKAERRAARDEKRRVYRDLKQTWKVMREEERKRRKQLQAQEDEEGKRLAVAVAKKNREDAMKAAADLGFTLENVEGVDEIKPKALGMKGRSINFEDLEVTGEGPSDLRSKVAEKERPFNPNRVDLSAIADETATQAVFGDDPNHPRDTLSTNFVSFSDVATNANMTTPIEHQPTTLNHRLRRKLRRAIDNAQIRKERLVRQKAIEHCKAHNIPIPPILESHTHPVNQRGSRTLPSGALESAKQERVRARVELAEFNKWAKVLRRQAKEKAIEAGIRVYLELMDRIPRRVTLDKARKTGDKGGDEGVGDMMNAADIIANWPMPGIEEGRFGEGYVDDDDSSSSSEEDDGDDDEAMNGNTTGGGGGDNSAEDSADRQLRGEMKDATIALKAKAKAKGVQSEESDEDSDEDSSSSSEEEEEELELEDVRHGDGSSDEDEDEEEDEDMSDS